MKLVAFTHEDKDCVYINIEKIQVLRKHKSKPNITIIYFNNKDSIPIRGSLERVRNSLSWKI